MPRKKTETRGRPVIKTHLDDEAIEELQTLLEQDPLPADAIRTTRHAMGLSQTAFAEKVGAKRRTVQDWESNLRSCKGAWRLCVIGLAKKVRASKAPEEVAA